MSWQVLEQCCPAASPPAPSKAPQYQGSGAPAPAVPAPTGRCQCLQGRRSRVLGAEGGIGGRCALAARLVAATAGTAGHREPRRTPERCVRQARRRPSDGRAAATHVGVRTYPTQPHPARCAACPVRRPRFALVADPSQPRAVGETYRRAAHRAAPRRRQRSSRAQSAACKPVARYPRDAAAAASPLCRCSSPTDLKRRSHRTGPPPRGYP